MNVCDSQSFRRLCSRRQVKETDPRRRVGRDMLKTSVELETLEGSTCFV